MTNKKVEMTAADWRCAAEDAIERAVGWIRSDDKMIGARNNALRQAAELLRAADTFNGRANMLEIFQEGPDTAEVETLEAR